jgi:transcriptional regulator with XRE-family HTH domain/KaiC/GvpD/RAD55 family RecA-like ATPase
MGSEPLQVTSGIDQLDQLLGGLFIGDNVVWYDDAGSLAEIFCRNFIQASRRQEKHLIYVSFDRSPKNLLDHLGPLADSNRMIILDCFTFGKGAGSDVFLKFYEKVSDQPACRIIQMESPREIDRVIDTLYGLHANMEGDVRFVFESLTGMQELWEGEEHIGNFYAHSCPRLYELNTIAYWIIEKRAHSQMLRAKINQIAQVAIDLSVKRGKTSLSILKADRRQMDNLNRPHLYWSKNDRVIFESESGAEARIDLGSRLKSLRARRGLAQKALAKRVGVTPSTISQVEANLIYPSLPALFKMAEVLSVDVSTFFKSGADRAEQVVFSQADASDIRFPIPEKEYLNGQLLTPLGLDPDAEPYLIEIQTGAKISSHFFIHRGHELGYLLEGELQMKIDKTLHTVRPGDVLYLRRNTPSMWENTGSDPARLLWIKVK